MGIPSGAGIADRGFALAALAIAAVGLLLRLHRIGEPELWLDEAVSYGVATGPDLVGQLLAEGNGPVYHLLLRAWTTVADTSEAALRAPSALAGAGMVAAVAWLGRALFGRGVGLWSAALAALAPLHVHYSQEVRAYALMTGLVALGHLAAWRAIERDTWPRWTALGVVAAAAVLAHYLAALSLLAGAPFAFVWGTRRQRRRYALTLAAAGLVVAVWIAASAPHAGPNAAAAFSAAWLGEVWQGLPRVWPCRRASSCWGSAARRDGSRPGCGASRCWRFPPWRAGAWWRSSPPWGWRRRCRGARRASAPAPSTGRRPISSGAC